MPQKRAKYAFGDLESKEGKRGAMSAYRTRVITSQDLAEQYDTDIRQLFPRHP